MNAILESHITAALGRDRAQADGSGAGRKNPSQNHIATWSQDYGPGRQETAKAAMDATRFTTVSSGNNDGDSGAVRKDRLDNGVSRLRPSLWTQMNEHLCAGTKVLAVCVGLVAFIAVI